MARLLVDKGCNPNKKNRHDKTALAIATECELREVRGYLNRKTTDKPAKGNGSVSIFYVIFYFLIGYNFSLISYRSWSEHHRSCEKRYVVNTCTSLS